MNGVRWRDNKGERGKKGRGGGVKEGMIGWRREVKEEEEREGREI